MNQINYSRLGITNIISQDNIISKKYIVPTRLNYKTRFCFVTTSYNQSQFVIQNLDSIRAQKYKNYYVNYVNDCSDDITSFILKKYKRDYPNFNLNIITTNRRYGPCYARKLSYMNTPNEDVCVFLDGDDFLVGDNVLNILAEAYESNNVYATFGSMTQNKWQYRFLKQYNRKQKNYYPHLRTAKSKIVKRVPDNYLKDKNGDWFMFTTDVALFTAVTELCGNKYMFITNELVIYNNHNNQNNKEEGHKNQNTNGQKMRKWYHETIRHMIPLDIYEALEIYEKLHHNNDIYVYFMTLIMFVIISTLTYYKFRLKIPN